MEELVISATGVAYAYNAEQIASLIRSVGRIPAVRNSKYEILQVLPG